MRICLAARAGLELVTFRSQSRGFPSTPHMSTKFSNLFSNSSVHGTSSIDTSKLLIGRPHGGCCFIYNNNLSTCIKSIPTDSDRFCCMSLTFNGNSILYMFCIYMPFDNNAVDSLHVYVDVLTQISAVCDKYCAEYICIGGDMNTDLTRLHSYSLIKQVRRN